jgi:hypothetical protein
VQPRDDFLVHETALTQLYAKETWCEVSLQQSHFHLPPRRTFRKSRGRESRSVWGVICAHIDHIWVHSQFENACESLIPRRSLWFRF